MVRKIASLVFVSVLLLSAVLGNYVTLVAGETVTGVNGDLELQMTVENTTIVIGEQVNLTLTLKNNGNSTITLTFPDTQVFDIFLFWRDFRVNVWSRDKLFAQVIIDVELEPEETYSQTLKWNFYFWDGETYIAPPPGNYSLVGVVVGFQYELRVVTPELPIILIDGPKAIFTESKTTALINETIYFDASGSLPGHNGTHYIPIANYTWDFGDGNITTVTDRTIYHTYTSAGTYTMKLTVTCEDDSVLIANNLTSNTINGTVRAIAPRSHLIMRLAEMDSAWPYAPAEERAAIFKEIIEIDMQWPYAAS